MRVTFLIPDYPGNPYATGKVKGDFFRMIGWWKDEYENCFTISGDGQYRHCDFTDKNKFQLFLDTFKPIHSHWWENAIIDRCGESNE